MLLSNVGRELLDHPLAPGGRFDLEADELADVPVKLDQRRVDGGDGANPRGIDQSKDFIEVAVLWGARLALRDKFPFGVSG